MAQKRIQKKIIKKIEEFANILKQDNLPIKEVYLFGSFAKGNPHKWSDIDVCVISPKFTNSFDALQYLWRKCPNIQNPLEPHLEPIGYSPKEFREKSALKNEIRETGIRIL